MLVLLPVAALGTAILAARSRLSCWQDGVLGGAVVWGVALVGITELLSLCGALTTVGLALAWLVVWLAELAWLWRARAWPRLTWPAPRLDLDRPERLLVVPLGVLLLMLGAIAVISPPNTWDSMTYHLARVVHWQQQASLARYPTHILRQLYLQPGAEFAVLHLQVLSGGDHLAGLVQWASMLGTLVGVSRIAGQLGADRLGALCASIVAASVPMGILQSTSTQNDYVVTFWLVCSVVFALRLLRQPAPGLAWLAAVAWGASLGLALVTKATAYLLAFPFGLWVAVHLVRCLGRRGLALLVVVGLIALALNAGVYTRNVLVFHSPIGPPDEGQPTLRYTNAALSPALFVSNVVRDLGLNMVATPSPSVNVRSQAVVLAIHAWLGVDVADPRTTWGNERFREQSAGLAFDENFAGNPIHLLLVVLALAMLWPLRRRLGPPVVPYAAALVAAFALFAAVLRWQPWHTRLELPLLVLGAPLVAVVAERLSRRLAAVLAGLLLVTMLPWVAYNQARPLVGPRSILLVSRADQYFTNRPSLRAAYQGALGLLAERGCRQVGFMSSADGWEYPLAALLPGVEVEHVAVTNVSARQAGARDEAFRPCAVLALGSATSPGWLEWNGQRYQTGWAAGADTERVAVLTVSGTGPPPEAETP